MFSIISSWLYSFLAQNVLCLRSIHVFCQWGSINQIFWTLFLTFYFLPIANFCRKDYLIDSDDSNVKEKFTVNLHLFMKHTKCY